MKQIANITILLILLFNLSGCDKTYNMWTQTNKTHNMIISKDKIVSYYKNKKENEFIFLGQRYHYIFGKKVQKSTFNHSFYNSNKIDEFFEFLELLKKADKKILSTSNSIYNAKLDSSKIRASISISVLKDFDKIAENSIFLTNKKKDQINIFKWITDKKTKLTKSSFFKSRYTVGKWYVKSKSEKYQADKLKGQWRSRLLRTDGMETSDSVQVVLYENYGFFRFKDTKNSKITWYYDYKTRNKLFYTTRKDDNVYGKNGTVLTKKGVFSKILADKEISHKYRESRFNHLQWAKKRSKVVYEKDIEKFFEIRMRGRFIGHKTTKKDSNPKYSKHKKDSNPKYSKHKKDSNPKYSKHKKDSNPKYSKRKKEYLIYYRIPFEKQIQFYRYNGRYKDDDIIWFYDYKTKAKIFYTTNRERKLYKKDGSLLTKSELFSEILIDSKKISTTKQVSNHSRLDKFIQKNCSERLYSYKCDFDLFGNIYKASQKVNKHSVKIGFDTYVTLNILNLKAEGILKNIAMTPITVTKDLGIGVGLVFFIPIYSLVYLLSRGW